MNLNPLAAEEQFLNPLDRVNGFDIRPGLYEINGATSFGSCVNFTIHSQNAVSCELLLFHRGEKEPYGTIPFPENYRIGRVYSMIVFGHQQTPCSPRRHRNHLRIPSQRDGRCVRSVL